MLQTLTIQQRGADVGVGGDGRHHAFGIGVGVAAGKTHQVYLHVAGQVAEIQRDLACHVMGAFDQVGDDDHVADAFAAVGARIALQGLGQIGHGGNLSAGR
jgi:hypothetical protein